MSGSGLRAHVFGRKLVVNLYAKKGYRISPGANAKARAIGKCARGKDKATRTQCFVTHAHTKGK